MDSSVSSIVSRLGAGSGVDMVQLANDLAEVRYAPQIERLQSRNEALQSQISAASLLRNQITQLASALGDRIRNGDLSPAPTIGNPSVATPSVLAGTSPSGTYSLEVSQLASGQTLALDTFTGSNDLVGEGTLTLRFGEVNGASFTPDADRPAVEIAVTTDDTLATLANKINASGSDVTAYVANGASGAQLVLKGAEGAANGFVLEAASTAPTPTASPGDLTHLAWGPASDTGQLRQGAQDAQFALDTIAMTSASNIVTDLPEGLTLELSGTNSGAPTTISFADRTGQISGVMGDFVAALNDITSELQANAAALGGELGNDPGARALKRALSSLSSVIVMPNAASDEPSTLGDLGLSVNRDGSFRLDNDRLQETLTASPQGAAAMFTTGLYGVFATIDDLARSTSASGDPGSLAGSVARYTSQIERNDEKLAKFLEQQDVLRERMTRQFVAADRNVSQSNSTLSFIQSQIAIWNAQDN
ncbi:flagellar filament capping protein FliD [Parerythrobacter jejuensis]|uniref:Flagellar hook-associated protein 2 n=1 Tax=Parerythrobacter jejuensis TaxID=795812 RepID=A0A845ANZ0_9SPHN|nr:flagellar filament capping protein FliD [Parerythrobacter jejuensis]MXP30625.1 flagellar filament capping protein FliD [Parerythrobacter jejuensis]MXP33385.1 flagellar filament capping protein FliD [Parerythrobacter jejuensis]